MDASLTRFGAFFYPEALTVEDLLWKKLCHLQQSCLCWHQFLLPSVLSDAGAELGLRQAGLLQKSAPEALRQRACTCAAQPPAVSFPGFCALGYTARNCVLCGFILAAGGVGSEWCEVGKRGMLSAVWSPGVSIYGCMGSPAELEELGWADEFFSGVVSPLQSWSMSLFPCRPKYEWEELAWEPKAALTVSPLQIRTKTQCGKPCSLASQRWSNVLWPAKHLLARIDC